MEPDDFLPELNKTAEKFKDRVQRKIRHCITCQPYEGGDYVWVFGEKSDLEELFEDIGVPEKHRDAITEHLRCPGCGASGFERWAPVGLEDRYEMERHRYIARAESKFGQKLTALVTHLASYPSLGLGDPMGRKIRKEILSGSIDAAEVEGKWIRARLVSDHKVFTEKEMAAPPVGKSLGGRYHHPGQSVLYVANVLDLRSYWHRLDTTTSEMVVALLNSRLLEQMNEDRHSTWHPEYHMTRLVADFAREAGYAGLIYSSTRGYRDNAVLFAPDASFCVPVSRPRILMYDKKETEDSMEF